MKMTGFILALLCLGGTVLSAAPAGADAPPPPPRPGQEKFGKPRRMRGSAVWRAFARLEQKQQQELIKLQRTDPEKFAVEMRKLAEQFFKEEQQRRIKINALIEKYQKSKDAQEKESLKKELTELESKEFQRSLAELARILEEGRRRVAYLEGELNKRKANAVPAVEARVEALLKGEIKLDPNMRQPPPPHRHPPFESEVKALKANQ